MIGYGTPLFHFLDGICDWWLEYDDIFWKGVLIYVIFFMSIELIIHELGHYYFQRRFGIGVALFRIGVFRLYSRICANGTKLVLGIPTLMAESRGFGELGASEEEKNRPDAFYNPKRHPAERFFVAIGGALAVLLVCSTIFLVAGVSGINFSGPVKFCFGLTMFNQFFNVLAPLRFNAKYATDGWVAMEDLIDWYKLSKKPR